MQLLMRRPEIKGFVSVSPPANEIDFSFLAPCPQSGLILHGNRDNIVPEPMVEKVVQRLNTQKGIKIDYRVVDGANHFFNDQMETLMAHIHDYLNLRSVGTILVPTKSLSGDEKITKAKTRKVA
jgi:alpha/beta superfamily hydrolase